MPFFLWSCPICCPVGAKGSLPDPDQRAVCSGIGLQGLGLPKWGAGTPAAQVVREPAENRLPLQHGEQLWRGKWRPSPQRTGSARARHRGQCGQSGCFSRSGPGAALPARHVTRPGHEDSGTTDRIRNSRSRRWQDLIASLTSSSCQGRRRSPGRGR